MLRLNQGNKKYLSEMKRDLYKHSGFHDSNKIFIAIRQRRQKK